MALYSTRGLGGHQIITLIINNQRATDRPTPHLMHTGFSRRLCFLHISTSPSNNLHELKCNHESPHQRKKKGKRRKNGSTVAGLKSKQWSHHADGCSVANQFQTFSSPLPSPVKNNPPGPIWIALTSSLEKIFPLSVNLNNIKESKLSAQPR